MDDYHPPVIEQGLRERVEDLEELVRWLALPYGGNMPIFPENDMYGHPLEHSKRLRRVWLSVVGP